MGQTWSIYEPAQSGGLFVSFIVTRTVIFFVQIIVIVLLLFCPDDYYNTCSVSQETFDSQEGNLDIMYTPYPSGAVVWAKMVGYPW